MKYIVIIKIFLLIFVTDLFSQVTCQVTTYSSQSVICYGDSITITANATASIPANHFFDFNTNQLPQGWSTTGNTFYVDNICGQSPTGTPYFWASTTPDSLLPQIVTDDFNVCSGGYIEFKMKYSIQANASPCEGPDLSHEGVTLQYSINSGTTWVDIVYYSPGGYELPTMPPNTGAVGNGNTPYTIWNTFTVNIPPAAITEHTRFRWVQYNSSGPPFDNWGLDDIGIYAGPCLNPNLVWSNGLTGVSSFSYIAQQDECFIATLYDDDNNFLCNDTICINVININNILDSEVIQFCSGDTVLIDFIQQDLNSTYLWLNNMGLSDVNIHNPTITINTDVTLNLNYILQINKNNCLFYDTLNVVVNPLPLINVSPIEPQCYLNNNFNFILTDNYLNTTFLWNFQNANIQTSNLQNTYNVVFDTTGIHKVEIIVNNNECINSDTLNVIIYEQPIASFYANPLKGCEPLSVNFYNTSYPDSVISYWVFDNNLTSYEYNTSTTYYNHGLYSPMLIVETENGCTDSIQFFNYIEVYNKPTAMFSINPKTVFDDYPFIYINDISINAISWDYTISNGDTFNIPDFVYELNELGYYYINLIAKNEFGCIDGITDVVELKPTTVLYIPNSFTPGINDNINNTFKVYGNYIDNFSIKIFNRWGELLFSSLDINEGWTGKYNGKFLKQDIYVYKVEYTNHLGIDKILIGNINLIR